MAKARDFDLDATAVAIFDRLWDSHEDGFPAEVARHILKLRFPDGDRARMHELAARNGDGQITPAELREMDNYLTVSNLVAALQSRARQQ